MSKRNTSVSSNVRGPPTYGTGFVLHSFPQLKVFEGRRHMVGCDGAIGRTLQTTNHRTKPLRGKDLHRAFRQRVPTIPHIEIGERTCDTPRDLPHGSLRVDFSHKIRVPTARKSMGVGNELASKRMKPWAASSCRMAGIPSRVSFLKCCCTAA